MRLRLLLVAEPGYCTFTTYDAKKNVDHMHRMYNGAFRSQKVQIFKSALLQFRQYFEAVTQCVTAAEKCPLHTQLK
jgi:hypothetical protein